MTFTDENKIVTAKKLRSESQRLILSETDIHGRYVFCFSQLYDGNDNSMLWTL